MELGFIEKVEPYLLNNVYFPSKVGGKPAWLELLNLPSHKDLKCDFCEHPLIFLCQVYAPLDSKHDCFHRALYLFICKNENCCKPNSAGNIKAFRSQLPRENKYYPSVPPSDEEKLPSILPREKLCCVCGVQGSFICSKCKVVTYCSKDHQTVDWKEFHKINCCKNENIERDYLKNYLLPEFNINCILTGPSEDDDDSDSHSENSNDVILDQDTDKKPEILEPKINLCNGEQYCETELMKYAATSENDDKTFRKFKHKIKEEPEQVLRYERYSEPLWITDKNKIETSSIPNCQYCNSKRYFEFQIMPQLLNYFEEFKLDWGIINVYTCEKSCNTDSKYLKEYVYKQDIV